MEQNSPFESFELQVTRQAQAFLKETAKWAGFLSILGFIGIGFMVLAGFVMLLAGSSLGASSSPSVLGGIPFAAMGVVYLLLCLFYFFPVLYLYRFSSKAKKAINGQNTEELTACFESLKSHYKFIGILTLSLIAIYLIVIVVAVIAGVGAAAAM